MGALTGAAMVLEVQRRVPQLSSAQALAALNREIRWIHRQGSFQFEIAAPAALTVTAAGGGLLMATAPLPVAMDVGKAKLIANANGTPIRRISVQDVSELTNFNTPSALNTRYHSYFIQSENSTSPVVHTAYFLPNFTGSAVIHYHRLSQDIADSGSSFTTLPRDFDDLLLDLAESAERRIFDIGNTWDELYKRSAQDALALLDGYKSMSIQEGGVTESVAQVQQETQTGRA